MDSEIEDIELEDVKVMFFFGNIRTFARFAGYSHYFNVILRITFLKFI